jgi:hypothetical protein
MHLSNRPVIDRGSMDFGRVIERYSMSRTWANLRCRTICDTRNSRESWHRVSPVKMPLEAKRFRHVAVAIPIVAVANLVTLCPRQTSPQSQQPDVAYDQILIGRRRH